MEVSDSIPERKNLNLLSIAFIVFYAAGGFVVGDVFRISLINVSFSRPDILVIFIWGMLFWFCLRFWQKSNFKFWSRFSAEITPNQVIPELFRKFIQATAEEKYAAVNKTPEMKHTIETQFIRVRGFSYEAICNVSSTISGHSIRQLSVKLNTLKFRIYFSQRAIINVFNGNAFAEELVPYLLFFAAITGPAWSSLF